MKTEGVGTPRWMLLLALAAMLFAGFTLGNLTGYRSGSAAGRAIGKLEGTCEELDRQIAAMDSTDAAARAARWGGL